MKVISVRQPHASLIIDGIKQVESRSMYTKYRGRLGIHSSLTWNKDKDGSLELFLSGINYKHRISRYLLNADALPSGCIIGTVEVVDCMPAFEWCERMQSHISTLLHYEREWVLGDLSSNRYAWVLRNPKPLQTPITAKGRLGFWEYSALDTLV